MLAGPPQNEVEIPAVVARLAGGSRALPVWENLAGGLTFQLTDQGRFVKWNPLGTSEDLHAEADRMRWARPYATVPEVVEVGSDEHGQWLLTAALPGSTAVADRWKADPETAAAVVGRGLRSLHDALPLQTCPFTWELPQDLTAANRPDTDHLVVCHGDACAPNTLITDDGAVGGHLDLGRLGLGDRWIDLAAATWSMRWNYGPGWESALLSSYGIEADSGRLDFYQRAWGRMPDA